MTDDTLSKDPTFFAPGERLSPEEVCTQAQSIIESPVVKTILSSIPGSVLIINKERQIVAGNKEILDVLNLGQLAPLLGKRPGEAMSCVHADEGPSGCGTSRHCRACGAVIAIISAMELHKPYRGECTLSLSHKERLHCINLSVFATPVDIGDETFVELVFHDISEEKLREAVERMFLHDLRNSLGGIMGWTELMEAKNESKVAKKLMEISGGMLRMIEDHSCMLHAEAGDLVTDTREISVGNVLEQAQNSLICYQKANTGKLLVLRDPATDAKPIFTDSVLLNRILVNMGKNALEAIAPGQEATLKYFETNYGQKGFKVQNPGCIPEDVQLRIFQRAFSTKSGNGHGYGTYSMKILGENYLGGKVGFKTTPEDGTEFYFLLKNCG